MRKCPKCGQKIPFKQFYFYTAVPGYNNIDDYSYICPKCNSYLRWTSIHKIAFILAFLLAAIYACIARSLLQAYSFSLVIKLSAIVVPAIIIYFLVIKIIPKQVESIH